MWGGATDYITDVYSGDLTPEQAQERWVANMTEAFKAAGYLKQAAFNPFPPECGGKAPSPGRRSRGPATVDDMRSRFTRGWWFLAPGLLLMTLIVSVPLLMALRYSVHRVFLYRFDEQTFVGLVNYLRAFRDPLYVNALKITTYFTLGCLVPSIVLGLLVAFMLSSRHVCMRPTWLALFLIPFVVTPVVAGIAWRFFMWQQEFGVINEVLGALGGPDPYWLLERETALIAAIISNSWHLTPLAILVFYAALTTIPDELLDAGKTDGAGPMQSLWYIVLPMPRPHMLFVSIILITSAFREFDMASGMAAGAVKGLRSLARMVVPRA